MSPGIRDAQAVVFEAVDKSFGATRALRQASFTVPTGRVVALLGLNGAGKSTTVDLMLGLHRPDGGRVTILGGSPPAAVAAGRVAALLQTGSLPAGAKVREAIELSRRLYGRRRGRAEVLAMAGLAEIAERRCETLSGGQRQRVRFGMSIAGRPALMFLDEPTVALDVAARAQFWEALAGIAAEGTTVVFSTHYLHEADRAADEVVLLEAGAVAAAGTPAEVTARAAPRRIRFRRPGADPDWLASLDGVLHVEAEGELVELTCSDVDRVLALLYRRYQQLTEVTVTGGGLEDALLAGAAEPESSRAVERRAG